jgi:hypothetical protein
MNRHVQEEMAERKGKKLTGNDGYCPLGKMLATGCPV